VQTLFLHRIYTPGLPTPSIDFSSRLYGGMRCGSQVLSSLSSLSFFVESLKHPFISRFEHPPQRLASICRLDHFSLCRKICARLRPFFPACPDPTMTDPKHFLQTRLASFSDPVPPPQYQMRCFLAPLLVSSKNNRRRVTPLKSSMTKTDTHMPDLFCIPSSTCYPLNPRLAPPPFLSFYSATREDPLGPLVSPILHSYNLINLPPKSCTPSYGSSLLP